MPKFIPPFTILATKVVGTIGRWRPDVRETRLPNEYRSRHEAERVASEMSRHDQFSTQYNVMARRSEEGEPFWVTIYKDGWLKDANMRGSYEPPDQLQRHKEDEANFQVIKATNRRVPRFVQGTRANDSPRHGRSPVTRQALRAEARRQAKLRELAVDNCVVRLINGHTLRVKAKGPSFGGPLFILGSERVGRHDPFFLEHSGGREHFTSPQAAVTKLLPHVGAQALLDACEGVPLTRSGSPRKRARSPQPLVTSSLRPERDELHAMTKLLVRRGVPDPAARAWSCQERGMSLPELEFRLGAGERLSPTKGTKEIIYRGWIIRKSEGTHIGYTLPNSRNISQRIGTRTHRKWQGYEIQYPESEGTGGRVKLVDTLKEAKEYIDSYLGSSASPRAPRPSPRPDAIGSLVHKAARKISRIFK
jgi:hypothetical protein